MQHIAQRIGFIGAGNMASAILSGMINAGLVRPEQTMASDVQSEQLQKFKRLTGTRVTPENSDVVNWAEIVVFATKPFQMDAVCTALQPFARPDQLFISICAGVTTQFIEQKLGSSIRVVRVMPNTPALIGRGSTAIAAGANATADDLRLAVSMFDSVGISVVLSEDKLDLVTGLTGSGPAYLFYFTEALIGAGVHLGLTQEESEKLVKQMVHGAARMAAEADKPLEELRQAVTTKGGTTEAGLRVLEEGGFAALIESCVAKATMRSRELAAGK